MKQILLAVLIISTCSSRAQKDFKWELMDSVAKSKNQIYSDTKMFISETWKSANDVIQNDDKDGGAVLIKGKTKQTAKSGLSNLTFWYSYTIKFLMKDNKYKLVIDNVLYDSGPSAMWNSYQLTPSDEFPGLGKSGMSGKSWAILMEGIRNDLQGIADAYVKKIKEPVKSDW